MHLNAKPPIFVPKRYWKEIEQLSKAALMDIAWDYAVRTAGEDQSEETQMEELRSTARIITGYRKQEKQEVNNGN